MKIIAQDPISLRKIENFQRLRLRVNLLSYIEEKNWDKDFTLRDQELQEIKV
jgi:hypothetical protein